MADGKIPAFNDVAEHDVGWGAWNVDYILGLDSPWAQYVLSLGLQKLCGISNAETYGERYRVLDATSCPSVIPSFLHESFKNTNEPTCRIHGKRGRRSEGLVVVVGGAGEMRVKSSGKVEWRLGRGRRYPGL
ncbi:hypothetical protein F5B21DRAFT_485445 [Xylaria acuta]|nr:hypothetical protein F5B21DRAFT_485445 [Xylaria acuta]